MNKIIMIVLIVILIIMMIVFLERLSMRNVLKGNDEKQKHIHIRRPKQHTKRGGRKGGGGVGGGDHHHQNTK